MAKGATTSEGSGGDDIQHFSHIRVRVVGQGQIFLSVASQDYVRIKTLVPLVLKPVNRQSPDRLVNFVEQRASFTFYTPELNTYFRINRIIVYMKTIYTSHPGSV